MATETIGDIEVDIPKTTADVYPKSKATIPEYERKNFADNTETVNKFLKRAYAYYEKFQGQGPRTSFETWMEKADQLIRVAADITKQDNNKTPDSVDTRPDIFYRVIRTITANDNDILFGGSTLKVRYEPLPDIDPELWQEAKENCDDQNALLEYSNERDRRLARLRTALWRCYKYGNLVIGMHWNAQERETRQRLPKREVQTNKILRGSDGRPYLEWKNKTQRDAGPTFEHYDMKDFWFDANIEELHMGQCVLRRVRLLLEDLIAGQKAGLYMNVQYVGAKQLYLGESPSAVLAARQTNAGDGVSTEEATGYYDAWEIWLRAPIDKDGEWDEDNAIPTWHVMRVVGDIAGQMAKPKKRQKEKLETPIALQLCANPYYGYPFLPEGFPYKLIHSHWDDKGAFHMGYVNILEPAWHEYKTTLDQWFYNKNLVNCAPWKIEKGALASTDKVFGPQKVLLTHIGKFDKIERLRVEANTQDMLPFISYLEQYMNDSAGTTKPYRGEGLGSRASAQEARNAMEQSLKPAAERLAYIEDQLIDWVARKDAALWRQFAEPDQVLAITRDEDVREIKPQYLYGDMRVKLTAVSEYITDAMARMEEERLLTATLPVAAPIMGKDGLAACFRYVFRKRGFPVGEMFPPTQDFDAKHVAQSENATMIQTGQFDMPQQEENHAIHILEHIHGEAIFALDQTIPKERINLMRQHRLIHEQMKMQAQGPAGAGPQQVPGMAQGLGAGETPPATEAQAGGDMMAAAGGETGGL